VLFKIQFLHCLEVEGMIGVFFKRIDGKISPFRDICRIVITRLIKLEKENYLNNINKRPSAQISDNKEDSQEPIVEENADCLGSI
jgi:hypothetical protein